MKMRKRDKEIIEALERFKCLSRDQIASMFFNHTKKPHTNANFVLKRLFAEMDILQQEQTKHFSNTFIFPIHQA